MNEVFPLNRIGDIQAHPADFRLLERVPLTRPDIEERLPIRLHEVMPGEKIAQVVFMDTETTGLSNKDDRIIQLGMVKCTFSQDRNILLSVDRVFRAFEDPQRPLPADIVKITRITDDMVRGKKFDEELVQAFVADEPLMVAHNAKFDRPFFDSRFPMLSSLPWACSQTQINWDALEIRSQKLEFILAALGFFYDSHQADSDCMALVHALYKLPEAFNMLITQSKAVTYRIDAVRAPFDVKDSLKALNFNFDRAQKVWYTLANDADSVKKTLDTMENIYSNARENAVVTRFTAFDRFKTKY